MGIEGLEEIFFFYIFYKIHIKDYWQNNYINIIHEFKQEQFFCKRGEIVTIQSGIIVYYSYESLIKEKKGYVVFVNWKKRTTKQKKLYNTSLLRDMF